MQGNTLDGCAEFSCHRKADLFLFHFLICVQFHNEKAPRTAYKQY